MTENTTSLPAEVTPAETAPAIADTEPKTVTPQDAPAGESAEPSAEAKTEAGTPDAGEKDLTDAEKRRKERNRERWREMNRTREDALRRAAAAEAEVKRLRGLAPADYSQFADPDEAIAERTAAKLRDGQAADLEARAEQDRATAKAAMAEAWQAHVEEISEKHPDFLDKFRQTPIHQYAAPFIAGAENGGEIALYLANKPAEAHALYDAFERNPAQGLIELGRVQAKIAVPPAKKTSTAPPPAQTLNGGRSPAVFDPSTASTSDVAAYLKKAGII